MQYNQGISTSDFLKKLESYQNQYKELINTNYSSGMVNDSNNKNSSKKPKRSIYDILFEPKYDSILDIFKDK